MEMDPNIRKFLYDLIMEGGAASATAEYIEKAIQELYGSLEEHLVMAVLQALPEDKQGDFQHQIEEGEMNPQEVEQYVRGNLPNYQEVFVAAFQQFRQTYLEGIRGGQQGA